MQEQLTEFKETWKEQVAFELAERARKKKQAQSEKRQFYRELGEVICKYRNLRKMSRQTLGSKLEICDSDVYFYESGRRIIPLDLFMKICMILNIDFRFTSRFSLEDEELKLVQAFRKRDYKYILSLLAEEI